MSSLNFKTYSEEDGLGAVLLNEYKFYNIDITESATLPPPQGPTPPIPPSPPTDPVGPEPNPPTDPQQLDEPELPNTIKIALVGDSTVATYGSNSSKQGWGYALPSYINSSNTKIYNHASGGKSTKTFRGSRWNNVLKSGAHVVFIQFGHNDSSSQEKGTTLSEYKSFLRLYVKEAREKKMRPILVTPVRRVQFKNGKSTSSLTGYSNAMKEVASELKVSLLDLHDLSGVTYNQWGQSKTKSYFTDSTHTTPKGAHEIAKIVAGEAPNVVSDLDRHFKR